MWNIVIGLIFIVGAASGKLTLRGTNSTTGLMVVGGLLMAYGAYQMVKGKSA